MSLFAELRRRNVFRVGAAYAVVAWLLTQASDILLGNFGAPDWVFKAFATLLLLGFPLALVLAWAYELTPEGVKLSAAVAPEDSIRPETGRRLDRLIVAALIAVIVLMGVERLWFAGRDQPASGTGPVAEQGIGNGDAVTPIPAAPARSIAVLAFDDMSPRGDQAYFAEGISEELLNLLSRIDGLKVAARTSSFKFKGTGTDIREIGAALNVEAVLEGSVRKAGDQVRVTAQLIEVGSGFHLWSESYDRRLANVFAVQDEIASAIISALRLRLDIDAAVPMRTASTDAHDHYLRGRQHAHEMSLGGLVSAVEQYERALELDPGFAAAWSGLAEAWLLLTDFGAVPTSEGYPKVEAAAQRALELDPDSVEALVAKAMLLVQTDTSLHRVRADLEQALALNPNFAAAYLPYAEVLRKSGEYRAMLAAYRKAVELDPLSLFMRSAQVSTLLVAGELDEADRLLELLVKEAPANQHALEARGNHALVRGRVAEALLVFRQMHHVEPGDPFAAGRSAVIASYLEDAPLAAAWIEAAAAAGPGNKWEKWARLTVARWQGNEAELVTGPVGPMIRGRRAAEDGDWAEARTLLRESLDARGYREAREATLADVEALTWLAYADRQAGLPDWTVHVRAARDPLARGRADGGWLINQLPDNLEAWLARLAAISGDRNAALLHLKNAADTGFFEHWVLDREPFFAAWRDDRDFRDFFDGMRAQLAAERARLAGEDVLP
jgi:TolB-like protein/cytochrome c-type biogenesis protein CcmH/NrfG